MSAQKTVSVIIPNHDRVAELGRALKALTFQIYRNFEVIVVSNQIEALQARFPLMDRVKPVEFTTPNISAARNAGLAVASGKVIAFIDDDAVPEPTWLGRLVGVFDDAHVGATGGAVIGRDGVSLQTGLTIIQTDGFDAPQPEPAQTQVFDAGRSGAIKTPGTNCAFRRAVFQAQGGFDEAFHFYLDEADFNLRLNAGDFATAYVPSARVIHSFAASSLRRADRAPRDLTQIGASIAYYTKKHDAHSPDLLAEFSRRQRDRLLGMMGIGRLEPRDIAPLLASLHAGFRTGENRTGHCPAVPPATSAFHHFVEGDAPNHEFLHARLFTRTAQKKRAKELAQAGNAVTLIEVLPSARALTRRFTDDGYWYHRVGQFGRFNRDQGNFHLRWNRATFQKEKDAIAPFRFSS